MKDTDLSWTELCLTFIGDISQERRRTSSFTVNKKLSYGELTTTTVHTPVQTSLYTLVHKHVQEIFGLGLTFAEIKLLHGASK